MADFSRRSLITGLISLVAAPAIVRAASLMPVKAMDLGADFYIDGVPVYYDQLVDVTRKAFVPRLFVSIKLADPLIFGLLA